jgi:hypothetical protein
LWPTGVSMDHVMRGAGDHGVTGVSWLTFYTPGPALRNFYQNGEIF